MANDAIWEVQELKEIGCYQDHDDRNGKDDVLFDDPIHLLG
ncbi:Uncharacterised protein [Chlamydia trachomatis]|jgi:hypothetical protein|nr:Uncharacterised protein [Chlamydia trachomatis]